MLDHGREAEAFAAYLNARSWAESHLDADEQALFDQDLAKARAQMEVAWLQAKPTKETT